MGQYYKIVFKHNGGNVVVNDRKIEGKGYILAKLLEHSWLGCDIADAVAYEMYKNPMRLAWVGDYADDGNEVGVATNGDISYGGVWGNDDSKHAFPSHKKDFDYSGKWLVNHDAKIAMSFDKYIAESETKYGTIAPFPLLTAIGNNRGGGDYYDDNTCYDEVGTWAWNNISIEDAKPEGYEEFSVVFKAQ